MFYVSADTETTGLDLNREGKCSIIQFAAVLENSSKPKPIVDLAKFSCFCWQPNLTGEPSALALNSWILKILAEYDTNNECKVRGVRVPIPYYDNYAEPQPNLVQCIAPVWMMPQLFIEWYRTQMTTEDPHYEYRKNSQEVVNFAGKNFAAFDKRFLESVDNWNKHVIIRPRIIDPSVMFADWQNDSVLPSLSVCKSRAGLPSHVTHNAIDDAIDVINVLRTRY